ncbi:MAG: peptide/nickel transport system ATP-binding protein ddpF [Micromonosporaceae bacterium]
MVSPALRAHDVFCLYPTPRGYVAALRGLTLDVAAGERVVVHGPNGSGKTTLLRVLAGERSPSAGTVVVCGVDLVGAGERERTLLRARRLGRVDQHHARTLRPELSTLDNVAVQLRLAGVRASGARARAATLLDRLGLGELAHRRPATLSGGEAQRVAVCAAVAHEPDLILADEPTGELDRAAADEVYDLLSSVAIACGAALVLVSHDSEAMRVADRIVRIRDGRLSEEWVPAARHESLVVDDRGWVRLPEPLRLRTGLSSRARAWVEGDRIQLAATAGPATAPVEEATAIPAAEPGEEIATLDRVTVDRGGRRVLDGQRLALRRASLTVVRGRSGSGKSTLLRILSGLERPDAGRVRIGDAELDRLDRTGLAGLRRRYVGVAAQSAALIESLDVLENLALMREARGLPADSELVRHWLDALGLDALRHRHVRVLSGGERQRVSVARVLAAQPSIAVLDEPTSQQDEANAERLVGVLVSAARQGTALVAATHDPVLVAAADEVVTLS